MKLIIPGRYRKSRNKPRGKLEKKARAAFDRLKKKRLVTCATAGASTPRPRDQRGQLPTVKPERGPDMGTAQPQRIREED